jgi:hypothetical protein
MVPLALLLVCGLPALTGVVVGDPMLSGGGLGVLAAALPPALLWAFSSDSPENGGADDDRPGGGGPDDPPDPGRSGGGSGLDWALFDAHRRDWERAAVSRSGSPA